MDLPHDMERGRQSLRDPEAREGEHTVCKEVTSENINGSVRARLLNATDALQQNDVYQLPEEQPGVVL